MGSRIEGRTAGGIRDSRIEGRATGGIGDSRIEILAPAGSAESLRAAVCAGADAVYAGGQRFGARAYADNLSEDALLEAIDYVHLHGRRIYLTVNTLLKDPEIDWLYGYLLPYYRQGIDAVIVQDMGVAAYLRRHFPKLPLHASTQMSIAGAEGAAFWKERGITRVVPARELSLAEIRRMKEETGMEIESFVHGALCYSYSGQCLLSSMIGGRSGNRGQCAQPCRLPYHTDGRKQADLMSLKDLCAIDILPELMEAGIDSFKIEGRMKGPEYVYTVTSMYRKYADLYLEKGAGCYRVEEADKKRLLGAYRRRGYTEGYYRQHNGKNMVSFGRMPGISGEEEPRDDKLQEKINGYLTLSVGERAKLVLSWGRHRVECDGDKVQPALQQPLTAGRIEKQLRKTGDTPFQFAELQIEMNEAVFLPMQALNELRREGLERLRESVLAVYRREEPARPGDAGAWLEDAWEEVEDARESAKRRSRVPRLACLVQSLGQLRAAAACEGVDTVYLDSVLGLQEETAEYLQGHVKGQSKEYFLAMPEIFRAADMESWEESYGWLAERYQGVLIRNWESYQWLRRHGYPKEIRSDSKLYVFNRYSRAFLREQGIAQYTASLELNARELEELGLSGAAFSVYGYQPVMVTANCIEKTQDRCRKKDGYLSLRDRHGKSFAVRRCCQYCYNVIYNSAPLFLADQAEAVLRLKPEELRLDFTVETGEQAVQVMELYIEAFLRRREVGLPETAYTRGHFKRGVR